VILVLRRLVLVPLEEQRHALGVDRQQILEGDLFAVGLGSVTDAMLLKKRSAGADA
jgi:hypothetical protein